MNWARTLRVLSTGGLSLIIREGGEIKMHNHCGCEHQLRYCKTCDVVYCALCKREWGQQQVNWYYAKPTVWVGDPVIYGPTTAGTYTTTVSACTHGAN